VKYKPGSLIFGRNETQRSLKGENVFITYIFYKNEVVKYYYHGNSGFTSHICGINKAHMDKKCNSKIIKKVFREYFIKAF